MDRKVKSLTDACKYIHDIMNDQEIKNARWIYVGNPWMTCSNLCETQKDDRYDNISQYAFGTKLTLDRSVRCKDGLYENASMYDKLYPHGYLVDTNGTIYDADKTQRLFVRCQDDNMETIFIGYTCTHIRKHNGQVERETAFEALNFASTKTAKDYALVYIDATYPTQTDAENESSYVTICEVFFQNGTIEKEQPIERIYYSQVHKQENKDSTAELVNPVIDKTYEFHGTIQLDIDTLEKLKGDMRDSLRQEIETCGVGSLEAERFLEKCSYQTYLKIIQNTIHTAVEKANAENSRWDRDIKITAKLNALKAVLNL